MRSRPFRLVPALVAVMLLLVPAFAAAQDVTPQDIAINSIWVVLAAILVLFMQAGFAMLEVGLSRMKNAGAVMGKILINLSISFLMFWAVGFAIGFGTGNDFIGSSGWFMDNNNTAADYQSLAYSNTNFEATYFFQVVFCAVSLAIVFGSMLDRTKFIGYVIFGIVFTGFIYPTVAHWTWGGGWLPQDGFRTSPARRSCTCRAPSRRRRGADPRTAHREVPRRQVRADPRPLGPADDPRRDHPVGRLDGLQPGLVPERDRRQLRRCGRQHQPGRRGRRHRRHHRRAVHVQDA